MKEEGTFNNHGLTKYNDCQLLNPVSTYML